MNDTSRPNLLIIEDDPAIREGLELTLGLEGYQTHAVMDGDQALAYLGRERVELVLLDVMLPGRNGFEVLREIRRRRLDLPVILLTARTDEADKVLGLELGADDYVTKPFGLAELRARIRVALRRVAPALVSASVVAFGDVTVERAAHRVRRAGEDIPMTAKEFALLAYFLDQPERVLTREALLDAVWGLPHATLRTVDNFVMRLRSKVEPDPELPRHLVTVRGVGYRFSPTGQGEQAT